MSQEHRAESRKVYEVDRKTDMLLNDVTFLKNEVKVLTEDKKRRILAEQHEGMWLIRIGLFMCFGSLAHDFVAPILQRQVAEGFGLNQGIFFFSGFAFLVYGLIKEGGSGK